MEQKDWIIPLISGVIGFIGGIILDRIKFNDALKIERRKTVSRVLSPLFPVLENIKNDIDYALKLRDGGDSEKLSNQLIVISNILGKFMDWDNKHRGTGFIVLLEQVDRRLKSHVDKMRIIASNAEYNGTSYIMTDLQYIRDTSKSCMKKIKKIL